jgi:hypothetical protein
MLLACLKGRVTVRLTPVGKVGRTGQLPRVDRDLTAGQESSRSWSVSQFAFFYDHGQTKRRQSSVCATGTLARCWSPNCPKVPQSPPIGLLVVRLPTMVCGYPGTAETAVDVLSEILGNTCHRGKTDPVPSIAMYLRHMPILPSSRDPGGSTHGQSTPDRGS